MALKVKKLLFLTDPAPNAWYEISCYLKAILGMSFSILGILLVFHPFLIKLNLFGIFETGLTPTALKIIKFLGTFIWPEDYLGFLVWGLIFLLLGIFCFSKIKLLKEAFKKL